MHDSGSLQAIIIGKYGKELISTIIVHKNTMF